MARTVVLLYPDDAASTGIDIGFDGPRYGEVISRQAGTCHVKLVARSDGDEPVTVTVPLDKIAIRQVPRQELRSGRLGHMLLRAVCVTINGMHRHGQVTAYHDESYEIRTGLGTHEVSHSQLTEVAPVIAVLLWSIAIDAQVTTAPMLEAAHNSIVDRLLGQNHRRATKAITRLLTDLLPSSSMPRITDQVPWICPRTGANKLLRVGDVINFVFYKEGARPLPANIRIGETFSDDPYQSSTGQETRTERITRSRRHAQRDASSGVTERATAAVPTRQPAVTGPGSSRRARPNETITLSASSEEDESPLQDSGARFTDLLNTLTNDVQPPKRRRTGSPSPAVQENQPSKSSAPADLSRDLPQNDPTAIFRALAPHPELVVLYAQQLQQLSSLTTSQPTGAGAQGLTSGYPQSVMHLHSASDLVATEEHSSRAHQIFRPSRAQQEVHDAITAPAYSGKNADVYMDHVRASDATKFLAHPAISSRLYEIEFGACDLSVLHFQRFDLNKQLYRQRDTAVNMHNFSRKVDLPKVPDNPVFSQLIEGLSVLISFAKEFFNLQTREFMMAAKDFGEQLEDFAPWNPTEVRILAFWFSNVFGAYRLAIVNDLRMGTSTSNLASRRFSMQDPELSALLFKSTRNRPQMSTNTNNATRVVVRATASRQTSNTQSGPSHQRREKVPSHVLALIPKQNGRQLCMRYISTQGCPSKSKDRCVQSYLSHFEPTDLPEPVSSYVRDHYGGVREFAEQQ